MEVIHADQRVYWLSRAPSGFGGAPVELTTWILEKNKPAVSMHGATNVDKQIENIFLVGANAIDISLMYGVQHQIALKATAPKVQPHSNAMQIPQRYVQIL